MENCSFLLSGLTISNYFAQLYSITHVFKFRIFLSEMHRHLRLYYFEFSISDHRYSASCDCDTCDVHRNRNYKTFWCLNNVLCKGLPKVIVYSSNRHSALSSYTKEIFPAVRRTLAVYPLKGVRKSLSLSAKLRYNGLRKYASPLGSARLSSPSTAPM